MKRSLLGAMLAGSALLLAGGLAACSNDNVDEAPIENSAFDEDAPPPVESNANTTTYEATPDIVENAAAVAPPAEELPPPPPVEPDQQVLDDASATGMTSRTTRGEPTPEPQDAPVDDLMSNQSGE